MTTKQGIDELRALLGSRNVLDDMAAMEKYVVDERSLYRGIAASVVRPSSTAEVVGALSICSRRGISVVPQGGNTGYCGGATPMANTQIVVALERMNRVLDVDAIGGTITVEAGTTLVQAQQAAREHGLWLPLSMGSEGSCQIGGNLSTNAGGLAVLKFGTAKDLTLGLEAVLPDGTVVSNLKGLRKDNTGYDLNSLFIGSEGTLGIITAATLRTFPLPRSVDTMWLAISDCGAASKLLPTARRISSDQITSFEYLSRQSLNLVLEHISDARHPLDQSYEHAVLIELSTSADSEVLRKSSERIFEYGLEQGLILDGAIAESESQRADFWRLRENIPEAEKRSGGAIKHDICVRIADTGRYVELLHKRLSTEPQPRLSIYGHIGDGNLHCNLLAPRNTAPEQFRDRWGSSMSASVHDLAAEMDGSFSAEHGIGQLKRAELQTYKDPNSVLLMRRLKQAIDPKNIMNPGKIL